MMAGERIHHVGIREAKPGKYVLYWMQQAQRTHYNDALEYAVTTANALHLPLVTCFILIDNFPDANIRHYSFMLEGLRELAPQLQQRHIQFVFRVGEIPHSVVDLAVDAAVLVTDQGYLRIQQAWRRQIAEAVDCPLYIIESDVVVPVEAASSKEEIAARTLRSKLHKQLERFLTSPDASYCQYADTPLPIHSVDLEYYENQLQELHIESSVSPVSSFRGGETEAQERLKNFIHDKLGEYHIFSNNPAREYQSQLSPYLHFGQISPVDIALRVKAAEVCQEAKEAFLEQVIVRRELSMNFVYYNPNYDQYKGAVPEWARKSLAQHQDDERPYLYTFTQLENAETHDEYWNAAQQEMLMTGHMHNYMRMYWGKKIIEWSETPAEAFQIMRLLNNKYELDGRDPNGFTGIAWCFGKHDHPWKERAIFGKVRFMNAAGLKRKFDISAYVKRINALS